MSSSSSSSSSPQSQSFYSARSNGIDERSSSAAAAAASPDADTTFTSVGSLSSYPAAATTTTATPTRRSSSVHSTASATSSSSRKRPKKRGNHRATLLRVKRYGGGDDDPDSSSSPDSRDASGGGGRTEDGNSELVSSGRNLGSFSIDMTGEIKTRSTTTSSSTPSRGQVMSPLSSSSPLSSPSPSMAKHRHHRSLPQQQGQQQQQRHHPIVSVCSSSSDDDDDEEYFYDAYQYSSSPEKGKIGSGSGSDYARRQQAESTTGHIAGSFPTTTRTRTTATTQRPVVSGKSTVQQDLVLGNGDKSSSSHEPRNRSIAATGNNKMQGDGDVDVDMDLAVAVEKGNNDDSMDTYGYNDEDDDDDDDGGKDDHQYHHHQEEEELQDDPKTEFTTKYWDQATKEMTTVLEEEDDEDAKNVAHEGLGNNLSEDDVLEEGFEVEDLSFLQHETKDDGHHRLRGSNNQPLSEDDALVEEGFEVEDLAVLRETNDDDHHLRGKNRPLTIDDVWREVVEEQSDTNGAKSQEENGDFIEVLSDEQSDRSTRHEEEDFIDVLSDEQSDKSSAMQNEEEEGEEVAIGSLSGGADATLTTTQTSLESLSSGIMATSSGSPSGGSAAAASTTKEPRTDSSAEKKKKIQDRGPTTPTKQSLANDTTSSPPDLLGLSMTMSSTLPATLQYHSNDDSDSSFPGYYDVADTYDDENPKPIINGILFHDYDDYNSSDSEIDLIAKEAMDRYIAYRDSLSQSQRLQQLMSSHVVPTSMVGNTARHKPSDNADSVPPIQATTAVKIYDIVLTESMEGNTNDPPQPLAMNGNMSKEESVTDDHDDDHLPDDGNDEVVESSDHESCQPLSRLNPLRPMTRSYVDDDDDIRRDVTDPKKEDEYQAANAIDPSESQSQHSTQQDIVDKQRMDVSSSSSPPDVDSTSGTDRDEVDVVDNIDYFVPDPVVANNGSRKIHEERRKQAALGLAAAAITQRGNLSSHKPTPIPESEVDRDDGSSSATESSIGPESIQTPQQQMTEKEKRFSLYREHGIYYHSSEDLSGSHLGHESFTTNSTISPVPRKPRPSIYDENKGPTWRKWIGSLLYSTSRLPQPKSDSEKAPTNSEKAATKDNDTHKTLIKTDDGETYDLEDDDEKKKFAKMIASTALFKKKDLSHVDEIKKADLHPSEEPKWNVNLKSIPAMDGSSDEESIQDPLATAAATMARKRKERAGSIDSADIDRIIVGNDFSDEEESIQNPLAAAAAAIAQKRKERAGSIDSADIDRIIVGNDFSDEEESIQNPLAAAAAAIAQKRKERAGSIDSADIDKIIVGRISRQNAKEKSDSRINPLAAQAAALAAKKGKAPMTADDYDKLYRKTPLEKKEPELMVKLRSVKKEDPMKKDGRYVDKGTVSKQGRELYPVSREGPKSEKKRSGTRKAHIARSAGKIPVEKGSRDISRSIGDIENQQDSVSSASSLFEDTAAVDKSSAGMRRCFVFGILILLISAAIALPLYFFVFDDSDSSNSESAAGTAGGSTPPTNTSPTISPTFPVRFPTSPPAIGPDTPFSPPTATPTLAPTQPVMTPAPLPPPTPIPTVSPTKAPTDAPSASPVTNTPTTMTPTVSTPMPTIGVDPEIALRGLLVSLWPPLSRSFDALEDGSPTAASRALTWLAQDANLTSYSDTKKIQRFTLVLFFYSTGGDDWVHSEEWLTSSDECTWYTSSTFRDSCDASGNLVNLELEDEGLSGVLPPELALLSNSLERLELERSIEMLPAIKGMVPWELGLLTKLEYLSLSNHDIAGTLSSEIGQLARLSVMDLSNNAITGAIPAELGNLQLLNNLYLGSNRLSDTIPVQLGNIPSLVNLDLHGNQLSSTIPSTLIQRLSYLQGGIDLSDNRLTGAIPSTIGQLTGLRAILDMSFNQLSSSIPVQLGRLVLLRRLLLNNNFLTGPIPLSLANMESLTQLDLSSNDLVGSVPPFVCSALVTERVSNDARPAMFTSDCINEVDCPCCQFCCEDGIGCECQFAGANQEFLCFNPE